MIPKNTSFSGYKYVEILDCEVEDYYVSTSDNLVKTDTDEDNVSRISLNKAY